ncbi:MAG: glycoside hydrolase family 31 protein [Firmicutes bacterium]|nr:glycoside hydrolase family 31 protein [Bacillota bacterium]
MLHAVPKASKTITKIERINDELKLHSAYGLMCIAPKAESIIRVSFTRDRQLPNDTGLGVLCHDNYADWVYEESDSHVLLKTGMLVVEISKETGAVRYLDTVGKLLLAERAKESKILDAFDSYKVDTDGETKVEIIKTPDGEKRVVRQADKVFDKKLYRTTLHLEWQQDEALFGLGQAEEGVLNLRGSTQYLHQANMKIAIPFLVSTKGYGLLLASDSPAIFNDNAYGSYLYTEACLMMDYYFIAGNNFDEIIKGYRYLSGKAVMLPKWAFGYMQSQERYETQQELIDTVKEYRRRNIGLSCIIQDWITWPDGLWGQKTFDQTRYPDPEGMMKELHAMDACLLLSIWPHMDQKSDNYREFKEQNLLLPMWNVYDAFNPSGRKLYWEQVNRGLFSKGVDGWWCDNNEPVTPEWTRVEKPEPSSLYYDYVRDSSNHMPVEKCNAYGLVHAEGIYEGQRGLRDDKRVINLTRSGYTGSQRYGTILWSGDTSASWDTFKNQIVAGLNFCASGMPYWTLDIGAFFVKQGTPWFWAGEYQDGTDDLGYRELYTRWFQYGAFLPIFRAHGTDVRREVWAFGEPGEVFYDALVAAIDLRYRLMPYIYSLAGSCWHNDDTIMRMLAFDFPTDPKAVEIKDQYMFGRSIMVCPVTEPMYYSAGSKPVECTEYTRTVYLPEGTDWYDFWTGCLFEGGQTVRVGASIKQIPLLVRGGSIIPMTDNGQPVLRIYPGEDAEFMYYEDAGDGYGYENGNYSLTRINWQEDTMEIFYTTIHSPEGEESKVPEFKEVFCG